MDWKNEFQNRKAYWQYSDAIKYHVKSSKNIHTDLFLNTDYLVSDPVLINQIVTKKFLPEIQQRKLTPDWIITYPPYGIPVAYALASKLGIKFGYMSSRVGKENHFNIKEGDSILIVCDDIYSGGSIRSILDFYKNRNIKVLNTLFCLGNFSNSNTIEGLAIYSVLKDSPNFWSESECPLCKSGSIALYHRKNWKKLF